MNRPVRGSANIRKIAAMTVIVVTASQPVTRTSRSAKRERLRPSDRATSVITATEKPNPGRNDNDSTCSAIW